MVDALKLAAGGLMALASCYIGVLIRRRYRDRETFYKSASEYASALKTELSYKKTPIPIATAAFLQGRKGKFETALANCMQLHSEGKDSAYAFDKIEMTGIKTQERKEVLDFVFSLGKSALADQLALIGRAEEKFIQKQRQCADDSKRLGGMYFKLFVLLGLAIILILA